MVNIEIMGHMSKLKKDRNYDLSKAYDKNMSKSAQFNYLKNAMADDKKIGKGPEMKGSMMHMGHDSAAKMYGSKSAMKMGHSPMKNLNKGYGQQVKSPMNMGTFMSKHSALNMGHSPMKETASQEKKNLMKDMPIDDKASAMQMGHSPMKAYHTKK